MDNNARIEAALADLDSQGCVNYTITAQKWGVDRSTLSRRHQGKTGTIQEAVSYTRQRLINAQEEVLITYINRLIDYSLLLTL